MRRAFAAEMAYYAAHAHEARDADSLAELRERLRADALGRARPRGRRRGDDGRDRLRGLPGRGAGAGRAAGRGAAARLRLELGLRARPRCSSGSASPELLRRRRRLGRGRRPQARPGDLPRGARARRLQRPPRRSTSATATTTSTAPAPPASRCCGSTARAAARVDAASSWASIGRDRRDRRAIRRRAGRTPTSSAAARGRTPVTPACSARDGGAAARPAGRASSAVAAIGLLGRRSAIAAGRHDRRRVLRSRTRHDARAATPPSSSSPSRSAGTALGFALTDAGGRIREAPSRGSASARFALRSDRASRCSPGSPTWGPRRSSARCSARAGGRHPRARDRRRARRVSIVAAGS